MSISFKFNENVIRENDEEEQNEDSITFKPWFALQTSIDCKNHDIGHIGKEHQLTKLDIMLKKTIKLLIANTINQVFLVTEDGEKHVWQDKSAKTTSEIESDDELDNNTLAKLEIISNYISSASHKIDWSNTRIVKATANRTYFLILTDDGKVYYIDVWSTKKCNTSTAIYQIDFKEKITCMVCGSNFYVIVTDNYKTYGWGINKYGELSLDTSLQTSSQFKGEPCEIPEFTGKTIVKVVCGTDHILALTDKGKVYGWGGPNSYRQLNLNNKYADVSSPIMINIANVKKVSDIAVVNNKSFVKSSENGLVYTWGPIFHILTVIKKPVICECTNAFDICDSMIAHSPISKTHEFINEEFHILNDLETAFNDQSTSDLTIVIEKQTIYVHKAILKIRCTYFKNMFQTNYIESKQSIIEIRYHRYVVYKTFLEYLYTGRINLSSFEDLLDLLQLADEVCEENLQIDCIQIIKKRITVSNVIHLFNLINKMAERYKKELMKYCFNFYFKNMTSIIRTKSFEQLDAETKTMFIDKGKAFFSSGIDSSDYLE